MKVREALPRAAMLATIAPTVRGRLFRKYVAFFVAVVCSALVANGLLDIWFSFQEENLLLIRIQREQAKAAAEKISEFVREIEGQLAWATQLPWSVDTLEDWRFEAVRLLRQVPAVTELAQLDAAGLEQIRTSLVAPEVVGSGIDYSQDPVFVEAIANKIYYGPVHFVRESEPYMTIAMAGVRRDHGVIVAQVNLKFIWDVVSQVQVGTRGRAYVVDHIGQLIAHPDISLVLRNMDLSPFVQVQRALAESSAAALEQPSVVEDIEGRQVLSVHAPIAPLGWLVFVELPVAEAHEPLYGSIRRSAVLLIAALVLAAFAGLYLARRMVIPIHALRDGAARVGQGDLAQRIIIETGDELQELGTQFNSMAALLQDSYATLERKVEDRTRQLAQSVEELRALGEISQAVNSTLDLKTVLDTIVSKAVQLSGCDAGTIYVLDEGSGEFGLRATYGMSKELIASLNQHRTALSELIETTANSRAPIQLADLRKEWPLPMEQAGPVRQILLEAGYLSHMTVPLVGADRVFGVLVVRRKTTGEFPGRTLNLLQTFAAQSVLAIQNARLFQEIEVKSHQLALASQHKSQFLANMSHELRTPFGMHGGRLWVVSLGQGSTFFFNVPVNVEQQVGNT